jgi:hypothetical protein
MKCILVFLLPVLHLAGQVSFERLRQADAEPGNWLTYSGNYSAHRYSRLNQITAANVKRLRLAWAYQVRTTEKIETSPLVVDGVMYLSEPAAASRRSTHEQRGLSGNTRATCRKTSGAAAAQSTAASPFWMTRSMWAPSMRIWWRWT